MKKYVFLLLPASFIVLSFANAQAKTSKNKRGSRSSISILNGEWQTTWQDANSNVSRMEFSVLHDGSNVSQD